MGRQGTDPAKDFLQNFSESEISCSRLPDQRPEPGLRGGCQDASLASCARQRSAQYQAAVFRLLSSISSIRARARPTSSPRLAKATWMWRAGPAHRPRRARRTRRVSGAEWCQTNANWSQLARPERILDHAGAAPLSENGLATGLEVGSSGKAAVEVIVETVMERVKHLETTLPSETEHSSLPLWERKV